MLKEVTLLIETEQEDDVLVGELDYFVRARFNVKKIKVNDEEIEYK